MQLPDVRGRSLHDEEKMPRYTRGKMSLPESMIVVTPFVLRIHVEILDSFVSHASHDGFSKDRDDGKAKKGNTCFLACKREEHIGMKVNFILCFAFFSIFPTFKDAQVLCL